MPTLMVSISGIRGIVGDGLDPQILVKYISAYAEFIGKGTVVVGRDARITGEMVQSIVTGALTAKGINVVEIGIVPTPTVQFTVKTLKAQGGIAISASHNPNEWNALKLLNKTGQFMTPEENLKLNTIIKRNEKAGDMFYSWDKIGKIRTYPGALKNHVDSVLKLGHINLRAIKRRKFKVLADCVNGAGVYVIPDMLRKMGCQVIEMNCEKTGIFPRLPEPLPENLKKTMQAVKRHKADLGIVVDPDVDRLVLINEKGEPFGEENTITQAAKFILSKNKGNVVVNLSTTRAVEDVAREAGAKVFRSAVGEANVVKLMKSKKAVIGGEGSGGVIYPALHYGRDALVGVAITLQHLLETGGNMSALQKSLPTYFIVKKKINLGKNNPDKIIGRLIKKYSSAKSNTVDGLRLDFDDHWVHFRKSNTEPILRIIVEGGNKKKAEHLAGEYFTAIKGLIK